MKYRQYQNAFINISMKKAAQEFGYNEDSESFRQTATYSYEASDLIRRKHIKPCIIGVLLLLHEFSAIFVKFTSKNFAAKYEPRKLLHCRWNSREK